MRTLLATLCLNEMEWLPKLYQQHRDWPNLKQWVFVEAADEVYAKCNPHMVSPEGLSVDGTSNFLRVLAESDPRVIYIPHGFTGHDEPDQGKCAARQRYLDVADKIEPEFVFVLDADEFYTFEDQVQIQGMMQDLPNHTSYCFSHVHPWRPPSISSKPLFQSGVEGGLWDLGFVRGWQWKPGCCYRANHNHVESAEGINLKERMADFREVSPPTCVHMGFTASLKTRRPKHLYYAARGEGQGDGRDFHVESRRAFEVWKPGDKLPNGATVGRYKGPIPECFQ